MLLRVRSPFSLTIEEILLFLYGFLGTMPILQIGGNTFFVYLTMLVALWNLLLLLQRKGWEFVLYPIGYPLILITVFNIVSAIGCLLSDMPQVWTDTQVSKIILAVLYLMIFLFYSEPERRSALKSYVRGIYCASIFQMLWAYAQFAVQMTSEISLNEMVFGNLLGMNEIILDENWQRMLTGLCWHSSNLAPLLTFGFAMSRSLWLKLAFALIAAMCGNRTALIGIAVCAGCQWLLYRKDFQGFWKLRGRAAQAAGILAAVAGLFIGISGVGTGVLDRLAIMVKRVSVMLHGTEGSAGAHIRYWTSIPQVIQQTDLFRILLGYGIDCSGYTMTMLFGQYPGIQWVVESDYINVLWSSGLVGLVLLYGWYFSQTYKCGKIDCRYLTFLIPLLAMGVTYNVLYNWCVILLYCIFLLADTGVGFREMIHVEEPL